MKCRNYAHRGFSGQYPENTMLAFRKALAAGCEGIEFDVHLTRDGKLVIVHDEAIDRTSDGTGLVRDYTYEELCRFNFAYPSRFGDAFGFEKIPTLEEYMDLVKDTDIITNIELKTGIYEYPGIEKAVYDVLTAYDMVDRAVVSSFNHFSVMRMKALDSRIACGFLTGAWLLDSDRYVKEHGAQAYHPAFCILTEEEAARLKAAGVQINTWTVNEEADIRRAIALEVDGIISNYPDRTGRLLKEAGLR